MTKARKNKNHPPCLVVDVQKNRVLVSCSDQKMLNVLAALGGKKENTDSDRWEFPTEDEVGVSVIFAKLRDLNIPFFGSAGGWPPAAIFELYREKGILSGKFVEALNMGEIRGGWKLFDR